MRLAPLSELPDGVTVGRDVIAGLERAPLLRAGVALSPEYRHGLERAGVRAIYVEDECSEGIEPPKPLISPDTQERAAEAVAATYAEARRALHAGRPLATDVSDQLGGVLERILKEVRASGEVAIALRDLAAADAYTFQHSVDVTALGMFLGAHVFAAQGWSAGEAGLGHSQIDERLLVLGMGLMLHDIGKLAIPTPILQKPGPLTPSERQLIELHPQAGFDLLANGSWSPLVKAIVLRHHEHWDGGGYPGGLRGKEIHAMARIAAVADVFDAVTSERPYAPALPAHVGLRVIARGAGAQFDPTVAQIFTRIVAPFPPGCELRLHDGRRALVVGVDPQALDRPRVRIIDGPGAPFEVSLRSDPSLQILGWAQPGLAA